MVTTALSGVSVESNPHGSPLIQSVRPWGILGKRSRMASSNRPVQPKGPSIIPGRWVNPEQVRILCFSTRHHCHVFSFFQGRGCRGHGRKWANCPLRFYRNAPTAGLTILHRGLMIYCRSCAYLCRRGGHRNLGRPAVKNM